MIFFSIAFASYFQRNFYHYLSNIFLGRFYYSVKLSLIFIDRYFKYQGLNWQIILCKTHSALLPWINSLESEELWDPEESKHIIQGLIKSQEPHGNLFKGDLQQRGDVSITSTSNFNVSQEKCQCGKGNVGYLVYCKPHDLHYTHFLF